MYWIIEFLARRKALGRPGHLYRMNQYMTVGSERNAFKYVKSDSSEDLSGERAKEEHEMFKQAGVDHRPDMDFDQFMQAFWEKIKTKAAV